MLDTVLLQNNICKDLNMKINIDTNLKKFLISSFVVVIFTGYVIHTRIERQDVAVATKTPAPIAVEVKPSAKMLSGPLAPSNVPAASAVVAATPKPSGKYKDGAYMGNVADAFYGNLQVQVVIKGGRITDVIFLQYPNDRETSIAINTQAMPLLKQEAISAQSARVDGVSGATASSGAFIESLSNALKKAV